MSCTLENSSIHNCKALIIEYAVTLILICEVFFIPKRNPRRIGRTPQMQIKYFLIIQVF